LAALAWWAQPTLGFELSLVDAVTSSPAWLHDLWVVAYDVVALLAVAAILATIVRHRWPLLLQCVVSGVTAAVIVQLVARYTSGDWASAVHVLGWGEAVAWPAAGITVSSAILLALTADVAAPARSLGMWAIGIAAVTAVLSARTTPTGVIAALLVATVAAAIARLVVGTAAGRISRDEAIALLETVGVVDVDLGQFSRQSDGAVLIEATSGGDQLLAKVLGRDVAEQRRMLRLWRSLMYRDGGAALSLARVPGLEREALATLLAETRGVPVWRVLTAGRRPGSDQMLVLVADGRRMSELESGAVGAGVAASAWNALASLHAVRLAHLHISPRALVVRADGSVALTDFTDATAAADADVMATDNAQMLVCLAILAGNEVAAASAQARLGAGDLAAALPFVQTAALPSDLHSAARAAKLDIDGLRKAAAEAAGAEPPELAQLRRVTIGSVIQMLLMVLAASAIISFFAKLNFGDLRGAFQTASVALLAVGFVTAQLPRLTQAIATLGSVPARLPFLPVYVMKLATCFLNIALPTTAGQAALSIRFFQRQGVPAATSVVSGLVESFIGNLLQALMLGSLLLFSGLTLHLQTRGSSGGGKHTVLVVIAISCVLLTAVMLVSHRIRRLVMGKLRSWWPDARAAASALRDRQKLAQLVGGNIATELLFASALALFVHAFGGDITLIQALFVNLTAALLVTFIPVPGGIGVAESALVVGLTGLGISQDIAFASAISYRVSTFYLPPIWGWAAMRWLEAKRYL
jgi:glycosyltransferase 2 family protein